MLENALKYLEKGLSVVPTGFGADRNTPFVPWREFQNRLPTKEEVTEWWTKYPEADISAVTGKVSGITVLDIDREKHDDPFSELPYYGDLPQTLSVLSGGKGVHLYFKYSERASKVATSEGGKKLLRHGIEIKSDGCLIKLPPSLHRTGNKYKVIEKLPMANFPDDLIFDEMLVKKSNFDKSVLQGSGQGSRNVSAASLLGKLYRMGSTPEEALSFMLTWDQKNNPPLGEKVIQETCLSMWNTHTGRNPIPESSFSLVPFSTLIERSMSELDTTDSKECVETGYPWLDEKIVGLFKGELMVMGGESGTGKTSFATNICYNTAKKGIPTAILALEDRLEDYGIKAIYFELGRVRKKEGFPSNYPWGVYRKNEIVDRRYKELRSKAQENLKKISVNFIEVKKQIDIDSFEKMIIELVGKGIKLFLVDHLHYFDLMRSDVSRAEYVENMMVRIKAVQNKTGARIILIVHYKKLEGKKPMLDSFKDSIAIPQNANYVINIWRDRSETGDRYKTKFFIPKARNPNGEATIELTYDPELNDYKDPLASFGSPQENEHVSTAPVAKEV